MTAENGLNPLQQEAVDHREGPALVLAGPGTGKTRILEERTVALLEEGVFPAGIALLTFTRKAADENRRRIAVRLPAETVERLQVSTLHSLALRILTAARRKRRCESAQVLDPAACYEVLKRALVELNLEPDLYPPLLVWKTIQNWKAGARDANSLDPPLRLALERYSQILAAENRWDLADLVYNAHEVLQTESDLAAAFGSVRYLQVDEFQDSALIEYRFLQAILGGSRNLFCVGALAQSIYAWRGADAKALIARFEANYPEAKKIVLRQNYRSGANIIAAAASMVPEEREVYLASQNGTGQVLLKECPNNIAETHFTAGLLVELKKRDNLAWPDFAILIRAWAQAGPLEQALIDHGVPYVLFGDGAPYYERPEVRAAFAYLLAAQAVSGQGASNRLDGALDMLINTPPRGIGPRSVQMIRGRASEITWDTLAAAGVRNDLRPQVRERVAELFNLIARLGQLSGELTPAELVARLIRETGWEQALTDELEGRTILRNLRTFQEEAGRYGTLESFVQAMKKKIKSDLAGQGIALATIHAAKGLEWPAVCVVGLNQGILPSAQSLRSAENGDPVEERRVAHVALSRARELLVLTWAREQLQPDGLVRTLRPSEFLGRLPGERIGEFDSYRSIAALHTAGGGADLYDRRKPPAEEIF
jgi:DNA helicase II / ATP-dependent DNA helicase PcrA